MEESQLKQQGRPPEEVNEGFDQKLRDATFST